MVLIAITDEGERVARHGASVYDGVHARVVEGMEQEELARVDQGIRRLLDALEEDSIGGEMGYPIG
jgi:DNA-binding MarR family transcriptional regulator